MNLPVLGIDVSKKTCDVHFFVSSPEAFHSAKFRNTARGWQQLRRWVQRWHDGTVHACLEATGVYGEGLARFLDGVGHTVSIVNPGCVHSYARAELQRNKTDRIDAGVIARFCFAMRPPRWEPLAQSRRELQDFVRHLVVLQQQRREEHNRLESVRQPAIAASLRKRVRFLEHEIANFQKRLAAHLRQNPDLGREHRLLASIPAIGDWTALRILAEIPRLSHFSNVRQVVAYAGLNPGVRQSGTSLHRRARLSKLGNAELRAILYMPALVALKHNPFIRSLRQRLRDKQKHHRLILGAAMRKLLHLAFGVLHSGKPFDPAYQSA